MVLSFIKPPIKTEENMTIYSIYKKNHPYIPKQVITVVDLGFLGVEKDSRTALLHDSPFPNTFS
jgi:hypothetical protein